MSVILSQKVIVLPVIRNSVRICLSHLLVPKHPCQNCSQTVLPISGSGDVQNVFGQNLPQANLSSAQKYRSVGIYVFVTKCTEMSVVLYLTEDKYLEMNI